MTTIYDIIPKDLPIPTSFATEDLDSRRDYEWYKDIYHLVSLSIHANDRVVWAALIGDEDPHGSFLIENGWPSYLTDIVKRVLS